MDAAVVVGSGNVVCGGAGDFDSMNEIAAGGVFALMSFFFEATSGFSGQEDLRWPTCPHMLHVGGLRDLADFLLAVGCRGADGVNSDTGSPACPSGGDRFDAGVDQRRARLLIMPHLAAHAAAFWTTSLSQAWVRLVTLPD